MLLSFLLLLPLLAPRGAPLTHAASPLTFRDTDPQTGESLECDRCPPGTYLRARCTSTQRSDCAPCLSGSFTELWNYIGKCLRCGVCGHNQVEKKACAADSDCQCACRAGFYFKKRYGMCLRHSGCPAGQGVLSNGTADEDTVCHVCPNGTFSTVTSAHENCTEHRSCEGAGLQTLLKGAAWHDSVCTSCGPHESRDGADYVRGILPLFFAQHKMSVRRLRHVVNKLPADGGRRHGGTSGLNLSDLHERISSWAASATAGHIRQLPSVLEKAGASGAADRLESKLRRADAQLAEQCMLGNEVDVDLMV